eukprot:TRINITY_DN22812_c0_g3_i1.p1 TRINITY_DN22812_c0_g3~~TRINITY_DN22812_c0_g3_i1.p1  ORF type:complete len:894 (+),score=170.23 TRINITY_DN22812_c0_g3_i1:170-2851(+)
MVQERRARHAMLRLLLLWSSLEAISASQVEASAEGRVERRSHLLRAISAEPPVQVHPAQATSAPVAQKPAGEPPAAKATVAASPPSEQSAQAAAPVTKAKGSAPVQSPKVASPPPAQAPKAATAAPGSAEATPTKVASAASKAPGSSTAPANAATASVAKGSASAQSSKAASAVSKASGSASADPSSSGTSAEHVTQPTAASLVDLLKAKVPTAHEHLLPGQAARLLAAVGGVEKPTGPTRKMDIRQREECQEINDKAMRILMNDLSVRVERGETVKKEDKDLLAHLSIGSFSEATLEELQHKFGSISLKSAIQSSFCWTLQDQQNFWNCNTGNSTQRLEEHEQTLDGWRLVQGDMIARGPPKEDEPKPATVAPSLLEMNSSSFSASGRMVSKLWKSGIVNYCFHSDTSYYAIMAFDDAVQHITSQIPCLHFQELQQATGTVCEKTPSIMVTSSGVGCWSHVGRQDLGDGESQTLNLGTGCEFMGLALHQLGHALGLAHTTARADRDKFIKVFPSNARTPNDFDVDLAANDLAYTGTRFDFFSVMNLPAFAFSKHGQPTILVKSDLRLTGFLGQRLGLSQQDVEHLAEMYYCLDSAEPIVRTSLLVSLLNRGEGYDDGFCQDEDQTGIVVNSKVVSCVELEKEGHCEHPALRARVAEKCPVSCMKCVPKLFAMPGTRLKSLLQDESDAAAELLVAPVRRDPTGETDGLVRSGGFVQMAPRKAKSLLQSSASLQSVNMSGYSCIDQYTSGLKGKDGKPKLCEEIKPYCRTGVSKRILKLFKERCPRTCGHCDLQSRPSSMSCFDGAPHDYPAYNMNGTNATCEQLISYCDHDEEVIHKCRRTCRACGDVEISTAATLPPTTTTLFPNYSSDVAFGCSRRRQMGSCDSRRRRDTE